MMDLITAIKRSHTNFQSWHTSRKLLLIESDDWGSVRIPPGEQVQHFFDACSFVRGPYERVDSLESMDDLQGLSDVLFSVADVFRRPAKMTMNFVVGNPDFRQIRASGFDTYYVEPFTSTYARYGYRGNFDRIMKGMDAGIFFPQFHGREHLNVWLWMMLLRAGHRRVLEAFDLELWSIPASEYGQYKMNLQAAFDYTDGGALALQRSVISEGLNMFESIFGFRSRSFIANNYIWDQQLHEILKINGVDFLQGMVYQKFPLGNSRSRKMKRRRMGSRNAVGQIDLVRNCFFEPSQDTDPNTAVDRCLHEIANAFRWRAPAIVATHRLNYAGALDVDNRDRNLERLSCLLKRICARWPDVEFVDSVMLGDLIATSTSNAD